MRCCWLCDSARSYPALRSPEVKPNRRAAAFWPLLPAVSFILKFRPSAAQLLTVIAIVSYHHFSETLALNKDQSGMQNISLCTEITLFRYKMCTHNSH
jgi:hypothetical protein